MTDPAHEIHRLHAVIEAWFRSEIDALAPFADALAEDFHIVSPSGSTSTKAAVIEGMADAQGRFADADPQFEIEIKNTQLRVDDGDQWLLTYEEHQRIDGDWEARTSSVLLQEQAAAPAGVEWVHLHETWLAEAE